MFRNTQGTVRQKCRTGTSRKKADPAREGTEPVQHFTAVTGTRRPRVECQHLAEVGSSQKEVGAMRQRLALLTRTRWWKRSPGTTTCHSKASTLSQRQDRRFSE
ncbi:hypothetical protein NDU88_007219 [Pleurodeles waltl]|uniref:Uncharacterized protein n=1 Tax=Pleurodeles waltl TaxID=8319 RepID=A0AAV7MEL3_PLEWA|nr:hypothetical protein NDU88_007219 [Pleurodeles waltl]